MQRKFSAILLGIFVAALPSFALAAPVTFSDLIYNWLIPYINIGISLILTSAVVIYMKNTASGIFNLRSGKPDPDWQQSMLWGIIILTLMVSIWGVLSVLSNTFFR